MASRYVEYLKKQVEQGASGAARAGALHMPPHRCLWCAELRARHMLQRNPVVFSRRSTLHLAQYAAPLTFGAPTTCVTQGRQSGEQEERRVQALAGEQVGQPQCVCDYGQ